MPGLFPQTIEIDPRHLRLTQLFNEVRFILNNEECDGDEVIGSLVAILQFAAQHSQVSKGTATSASYAFVDISIALRSNSE